MTEQMKIASAKIDWCEEQIKYFKKLRDKAEKEYKNAEAEYASAAFGISAGDRVVLSNRVLWWSSTLDKDVRFVNAKIESIWYDERSNVFEAYCIPYSDDWKTAYGTKSEGANMHLYRPEDIKEVIKQNK